MTQFMVLVHEVQTEALSFRQSARLGSGARVDTVRADGGKIQQWLAVRMLARMRIQLGRPGTGEGGQCMVGRVSEAGCRLSLVMLWLL